jgi:hypothetical protein
MLGRQWCPTAAEDWILHFNNNDRHASLDHVTDSSKALVLILTAR